MKRPVRPIKFLLLFVFSSFLFSCGIEQYYYLPQLSQGNVSGISNNSATVIIPSIEQYYYATYYSIFYRIYISNTDFPSQIPVSSRDIMTSINSSLYSDYNAISPYIDPADTSAGTAVNTVFKGRNYFELELSGTDIKEILSTRGGTLRLEFPPNLTTETPASYVILNNGSPIAMKRSKDLISPAGENIIISNNKPDYLFINSNDLNNPQKATANINADVAAISSGNTQRFAYVSMYIAAVGVNSDFTIIYSKPTHIGIFKLPDR